MTKKKFHMDDLCMKCFKLREKDEDFYGFKIYDDYDKELMLRGHESCITEISETLGKLEHFEPTGK